MKLNELLGIKKLANLEPGQIATWLQQEFDAGRSTLRPLGKGANAIALTNGKIVFKFWLIDSAYEKYVEFCRKNQNNPMLPKFLSPVRRLPRVLANFRMTTEDGKVVNAGDVRYVKMELLQPYKERNGDFRLFSDPKARAAIEAENDLDNYTSLYTIFEWGVAFGSDADENAKVLFNDIQRGANYASETVPYEKYQHLLNPFLVELMLTLGQINDAIDDVRFDGGTRNMAMRGDQVVILDPIVNDDDLMLNQEFLDLESVAFKKQASA